ncbi:MAG: chemotaxis protein CheW [Desulfobacterales bacterium]
MSIDPQNITILLVEDAAVMRNIEVKTLNTLGFKNIIEAENGETAIQKLEETEGIDIVISDWNMPEKDGFELLKWIRTSEKYAQMPFIMATGQGDKKYQQKALDAGVSNYIAKPFDSVELKNKIEEAFGIKKAPAKLSEEERKPRRNASGKVKLRIGHIQITDHLVLGVLKHLIEKGDMQPKYFELETQCLPGWNPVADALERGRVDAACVLAPIAMDLYSFDVPIKMILLAHKNGSIFVRNRKGNYREPFQNFFKGKSFLIPHKLSVHHMLSHMFFDRVGLKAGMNGDMGMDVNFEVVAPVKMPEFLRSNEEACGFMVAEPIGTKAIASGIAELQFLSGELWSQHPCCIVAMRDEFIGPHTDAVYELTEMLVRAGNFIEQKPELAAEVAVNFLDPDKRLGLKVPLLKNVLTETQGIKAGDLFPLIEDFDIMQRYMAEKMKVGSVIDLEKFIDIRFARAAYKDRITSHQPSNLHATEEVVYEILYRGEDADTAINTKSMLNKEGKYLTFRLEDQEYGIDILKIKEIIGMMPIRSIPCSVPFVKGVINLRDTVIPIIDLRLKFGMSETSYTDRTCIIVLDLESRGKHIHLGVVVDTVLEVLNIRASEIEDTPYFGVNIDTRLILGIAKMDKGIKILLDIEEVFEWEDEKVKDSLLL